LSEREGALSFFNRLAKYRAAFDGFIAEIGEHSGEKLEVAPCAAEAIVEAVVKEVRWMKRRGIGKKSMSGTPVEYVHLRNAALATAYVLKGERAADIRGTFLDTAREYQLRRTIIPALLTHHNELPDDVMCRVAELTSPKK
jgi:hypothetical protein